jgi:hypothetical protein
MHLGSSIEGGLENGWSVGLIRTQFRASNSRFGIFRISGGLGPISVSTVAILAQGTKPADAVTQAFFARFKPRPLAKGFPLGKEDFQSMKTSPCQARV